MTTARVLVTGSRTWSDRALVNRTLSDLLVELVLTGSADTFVVVHGDCPTGADRFARDWVGGWQPAGPPVVEDRHPARWRRPDGSTDRGAGYARNAEMVALGADLCVTFIDRCRDRRCGRREPHGSHGAVHCATAAAAAGIPIRHIR